MTEKCRLAAIVSADVAGRSRRSNRSSLNGDLETKEFTPVA